MSGFDFVTAAKDAETTDDAPTPITLDGRVINVFRPTEASLALLYADLADLDSDDEDSVTPEHLGSLVDFFLGLLGAKDAAHIKKRLRSRRDPFDLGSIQRIFTTMVEEWSGHPTVESQDSISLPETTGPTSATGTPTQI